MISGGPQSQVRVEAEVYSESFTVYSAKKFPGMTGKTQFVHSIFLASPPSSTLPIIIGCCLTT